MASGYVIVLIPIAGLFVNVLVQVLGFKIFKKALLKSVFLGFSAGLLVILAPLLFFQAIDSREFISLTLANIIIYFCSGYCYFHFINLGVTARRIRLLWELYESKQGLLFEEITSRYNARYMVEARLARLINSGQVVSKNDKYFIGKPLMLCVTKIIIMMKVFVLGKKSEFD